MTDIKIIHPGLLTSIQDDGRSGLGFYGIPPSGQMDPEAAHQANNILGNRPEAPVIECNLLAPKLRFMQPATFCITGADMQWTIDEEPLKRNLMLQAKAGALLAGKNAVQGARGYIAVQGTIECRHDYDSAATYAYAGLGGFEGRPLKAGDIVSVRPGVPSHAAKSASKIQTYADNVRILVVPGPEWGLMTKAAKQAFTMAEFSIASDSNRMGARLKGPALQSELQGKMDTVPLLPGTIQLPASGHPLVILAEGQTTGGYPRIAVIVPTSLARFNQIRPGQRLGFSF